MHKVELVNKVAAKCGLPEDTCKTIVDATVDVITESLTKGEPVQIIRLGTFEKTHVGERVGRDPSTGGLMTHPAVNRVRFKPNKTLKDAINH